MIFTLETLIIPFETAPKGKITAKNLGHATITIKSIAKPSVIKKVSVTVVKRKTNVIAMETGTAAKMKLTNKKVKNSQVKWTSSNKKVAKVYKNGIVKVVGNGSATFFAPLMVKEQKRCLQLLHSP